MDGALLNWREGFGTARKKRTTAGPKKQKARQTVALAQKKIRVPPLLLSSETLSEPFTGISGTNFMTDR